MTVEALRMIQAKDPLASFDGGETFAVHATEVRQGATRLQGEFYGSDGYRAAQVLILSGFDILSTGSLSEVLWFGPFARTYVDSSEHGLPFLTSSEMLVAAPDPNYISTALTKDLDRLRIKKNNILVSCSGSIGNTTVCNADQDGWAVSQDAIRVIPNEPSDLGVLATCFFSGAGQFLLTRSKSGSVVEHIYASDIEAQPIPHLPIRLKEKLTELVLEAGDLRVDANRLIAEAKSDALKQVGLAEFHSDLEHLEFETFVASSSLLRTTYEKRSRIRLESTFHNKRSVEARKRVEVCQKWKRLEDVVEAVPFTGPGTQPSVFKVEKNQGVPCVTGRDLGLSRPRPSSYITSQTRPLVEKMIPKPGTTLVMCAGTLGKTEYCWEIMKDGRSVLTSSG